ncbi:MAG: 16S rRNA (guanine(527)-N(7))-methyltransferase RsmG [Bifidobacteriaceae bacterium]|nr:16S rRNA (guanine(527)-N(7))-methyltransferase RsmG [Bifidobacteriaceae bacterium]
MARFADLLVTDGATRGLIGPREGPRLWSRHLVNCVALVPLLPDRGAVIDLGAGAGLPGIVVAAMRPDLVVELVEPMERRVEWLREVVEDLDLGGVVVTRARAEELRGRRDADAVMARAVAPLGRLAAWGAPLLKHGGLLLALKGRGARGEVEAARNELHGCSLVDAEVLTLRPLPGIEPTYVVRARAGSVSRETRAVQRSRYHRQAAPKTRA